MNNISDKLVLTIILITILFVFGLIFSVKSPERKVIDSPIMWKDDLANQISLQVVNDCGWSVGLIGKEGVDYFKSYFLEIYEKTTPDKNFSR